MGAYASARTSVNKNRLPALFTLAAGHGLFKNGMKVLDYGCGRWPGGVGEFLGDLGCDVVAYDPNWYPIPVVYGNADPDGGDFDLVCLSNVLNVIQSRDERLAALQTAWEALKPGGRILVTVYEADGSGASGPSKNDCWQERRKLSSYIDDELAEYLGSVMSGGFWASMPKPAKGEKFWPPEGAKVTLHRIYGGSETPCTVVGRRGQFLVVRECQLRFIKGPRYYDAVADAILPGRPGVEEEIELSWKTKGCCWHEKGKYGGLAIFGRWRHQPHVD